MPLNFNPPLLNSANPWATTYEQLKELYECPSTGAITTRTCILEGFAHSDEIHQFGFYDTATYSASKSVSGVASLNTLGYSPIPLSEALETVKKIVLETPGATKPVLISVTGSSSEVSASIKIIAELQLELPVQLLVEINLSCPNITGKPPPAFSLEGLKEYLICVHMESLEMEQSLYLESVSSKPGAKFLPIPIGIKTPPYSNPEDFRTLKYALVNTKFPFPIRGHAEGASIRKQSLSFITATNTLGCALIMAGDSPALLSADGSGIGGLAGAPLHPLALGNVRMLRKILDEEEDLTHVEVIGIGGVSDAAGFGRMKTVGASAVGVATALGIEGVGIFEKILSGSVV
jgi:dihydroorotate dehydrogenase (fumarate)